MIKVSPGDIGQQIIFVPRVFPTSDVSVVITRSNGSVRNEEELFEGVSSIKTNNRLILSLSNYQFQEGDTASITVQEADNIIYRGLITCTQQDTQEYSATTSRYTY